MKTLAIETSTLTGSVAILSEDDLIGEITVSVSLQHSERLMPAIERLLSDARVESCEIDLIAVSHGPGSFTGLRIGIAAAQGLSASLMKPVVGVSSLKALAVNGLLFDGIVLPVFDAFRGEVYRGLYCAEGYSLKSLVPEAVCNPQEVLDELRGRTERVLVLGNGTKFISRLLMEKLGEERVVLPLMNQRLPRASNVGIVALQEYRDLSKRDCSVVTPQYLRKAG